MRQAWRNLFTPAQLEEATIAAYGGRRLSAVIEMGNPADRFALGSGWSYSEHGPEFDLVWAEGTDAEIALDFTGGSKILEIELSPFELPGRTQEVVIGLNGTPFAQLPLSPSWSVYGVAIPDELLRSGRNVVRFEFAHWGVPADLDPTSEDRRSLAACFRHVAITDAKPDGPVVRLPVRALTFTPRALRPNRSMTRSDTREAFPGLVPGGVATRVTVHGDTELSFAHAVRLSGEPDAIDGVPAYTFTVTARAHDGEQVRYEAVCDPVRRVEDRRWFEGGLSLSAFAGREVEIRLEVSPPEQADLAIFPVWTMPVLRTGAPGPIADDRKSVLLVSLDTVRADHLGAYGYRRPTSPTLDAIAAEGTRFENAIAPSPHTVTSHATVFTGLHPFRTGVHSAWHGFTNRQTPVDPSLTMLPEIFQAAGYRTGAVTGGSILAPHLGFHAGFETFQEEHPIETATLLAEEWLRRNAGSPFFYFFHSYEVHPPWHRRHFVRYPAPSDRFRGYRYQPELANADDATDEERRYMIDVYDSSVRHLDDHLGRLVSLLREMDRLDDTAIVLFSDHGEDLWDHHGFLHGHSLYEELLRVPLIVRAPWAAGPGRVDETVALADVMPGVLDLCELRSKDAIDGRSFVPRMRGETVPDRPAFSEAVCWSQERKSVRTDRWKYIRSYPDQRMPGDYDPLLLTVPDEELYDLAVDPDERDNQIERRPDVAAEMRRELEAIVPTDREAPPPEAPGAGAAGEDEEIRASLAALGYVH